MATLDDTTAVAAAAVLPLFFCVRARLPCLSLPASRDRKLEPGRAVLEGHRHLDPMVGKLQGNNIVLVLVLISAAAKSRLRARGGLRALGRRLAEHSLRRAQVCQSVSLHCTSRFCHSAALLLALVSLDHALAEKPSRLARRKASRKCSFFHPLKTLRFDCAFRHRRDAFFPTHARARSSSISATRSLDGTRTRPSGRSGRRSTAFQRR